MGLRATLKCLVVAAAAHFGSAAPAATLVVSGGEITGATGVNVGGTLYDVAFVDGTCIDVFSGCDSVSDFTFNTSADADIAWMALLDQVLIDGPLGLFDSDPSLTLGCELGTSCSVHIPYAFALPGFPLYRGAINYGASGDGISAGIVLSSYDYTADQNSVWAQFTPTGVPEPRTWMYMLVGFGFVGAAMRRLRILETAHRPLQA